MKTTGNPQRRASISSWQRMSHPRNAVLRRIQTITKELEAIQGEIFEHLTEPALARDGGLFAHPEAAGALNLFKAELDQLRRILWFYIEEAAGRPRNSVDQEQNARRLEHFTALLRALAPQTTPTGVGGEQSGSFFERLNVVIDTYMEKKPVVGAGKTLARTTKAFS